jgi:hypothetical protein
MNSDHSNHILLPHPAFGIGARRTTDTVYDICSI